MAQINLLPWREEKRRQKTVNFAVLAVMVAIGAALVVSAARVHVGTLVDHQKARNTYLQNEIDILNTKLQEIKDLESTKENLLARMNIIQELQRSRPEIVHLFEEMVKTIPEGVWLSSITQAGKSLKIEGSAESNARVSAYMRNLDASEWLKNPILEVIESGNDNSRIARFKLNLYQESPLATEDDEEEEG